MQTILQFIKLHIPLLAVIIVTALLLISIFFGIERGKETAKARIVLNSTLEIQKGLQFFYQDQERFPSSSEWEDINILLAYFNFEPDNVSKAASCSKNFIYKRLSANNYELDFCLARDLGNFNKGWNKVVVSK